MTNFWEKVQMASSQKGFRAWVIATVLGLWLGYFVTSPVYLLAIWLKSTVAVQALQALLGGLTIGVCQWVVLKRDFNKAYWWIVATVLGNFFAVVLFRPLFGAALVHLADPSIWDIAPLFESVAANSIAQALAAGLSIGIAQWLYLRTRLPNTAAWVPVVMGATLLSWVVWLVPVPQFQSLETDVQGMLEVFQPSLKVQLMMMAFHLARLSLVGVIQGGIMGIWLTDFVARQRSRSYLEGEGIVVTDRGKPVAKR